MSPGEATAVFKTGFYLEYSLKSVKFHDTIATSGRYHNGMGIQYCADSRLLHVGDSGLVEILL